MTANALIPFSWESLQLNESVMVDNVPHFTRRSIGELLDYDHQRQAIGNIIDRNEYLRNYSVVLNMRTTDGNIFTSQWLKNKNKQWSMFLRESPKPINRVH